MATNRNKIRRPVGSVDTEKLNQIVAKARQAREDRLQGYRAQSLRLHPHICGRCGREFTRENMHELTVHHKDHNHDNNPPDGSNWENLCLYCHDYEHQKYVDVSEANPSDKTESVQATATSTFNPFANLKDLLNQSNND